MSVYKLWQESSMVSFPDELWHGSGLLPGRFRGWCRGAVRLSGNPGARSALSALSHGLHEKEQRSARLPGAQHQSRRRPEKKRASVHSQNSKAPLQAQRPAEEGEREPKVRLNSVGSQAAGAPSGQKGLSAGEEAAPGPGGSIKGSCVPAALKVTFVFRVQVKGRLQKEPPGSPPSSGIWSQEWPSSFSKMLGIQMKIAMCLPASWEISQCLCQ